MGASIEIRPELQRNILKFGYGINYKYKGMLAHSFDRFCVVFSKLEFGYTCTYTDKEYVLLCGIYNVETLEKLINTGHEIDKTTSSHEKLFAGEHNHSIFRILYINSLGLQHYSINSLLYFRIIQDKYISLHRELIT